MFRCYNDHNQIRKYNNANCYYYIQNTTEDSLFLVTCSLFTRSYHWSVTIFWPTARIRDLFRAPPVYIPPLGGVRFHLSRIRTISFHKNKLKAACFFFNFNDIMSERLN